MFYDPAGPIERFEWGKFQVNGKYHSAEGEGVGKDIFLLSGTVQAWHARKGHRLKPEMVSCILGKEIDVLVIGNGVNGALKVTKKTRKAILASGIQNLIVETTPKACAIYNQLVREGKQTALLAHGTC